MQSLDAKARSLRPHIESIRHAIHAFPEPGFEEVETQKRILGELEELGLSPEPCAETGVIVDIGQGGGPILALRADVDCLQMTEENPGLAYRSKREGFAHMCGHDGHTASLLGAAHLLAPVQDALPGRVRLLFQPAEEGPGGAPKMIEEGALDGVDEVYGMHNWPQQPLGTCQTIVGPCMATVAEFEIWIRGKGGHASQPQVSIDPVVAGAQVVTALQTVIARNVHYEERAVVSVTSFHGGEAFNVIPDAVRLGGTIRSLSDDVYDLIAQRVTDVATQTAAALGAKAEVHLEPMYPTLVNTAAETGHVTRAVESVLGEGTVSAEGLPMLGAEDFSYFLRERPGCYFFLGTGEEGRTNSMCHATDFDFNDNLLVPAMSIWVRLCEARLGGALYA